MRKSLYEQISIWSSASDLNIFPEPDTLPYQRIIADFSVEQERLQVLSTLNNAEQKKTAPFIIASVPALIHKIMGKDVFAAACHTVITGSEIDPLALIGRWESMGYVLENRVESPGTISRRGGIVDIFPPTTDLPVRLEFFGNTIESIRLFESGSQRSVKVVNSIEICPATEILLPGNKTEIKSAFASLDLSTCSPDFKEQFEHDVARISEGHRPPEISFYSAFFNAGNILDYLPANGVVILDDLPQIVEEAQYLDSEAAESREEKISAGELPTNFPSPYFTWNELEERSGGQSRLNLVSWVSRESPELINMNFISAPGYAGQLPALISKSKGFMAQGQRLIFISNQASRLSELFEEADVFVTPVNDIETVPAPGSLTLVQGSLAEGWTTGNTHILTDKELFGFVKERRLLKRRSVQHYKLLVDIKPGDYVVHIEHGIGQFTGIQNMTTDSYAKRVSGFVIRCR